MVLSLSSKNEKMKIQYKFLWFVIPIGIIILLYSRIDRVIPSDLYSIGSKYYLDKIDYFSDYSVVKQVDGQYQTVIHNVIALYPFERGILIKSELPSREMISFLPEKSSEIIIIGKSNERMLGISIKDLSWKKPWQIVETVTLNSSTKLLSQILLISIAILSVFIIMRTFNIPKIQLSFPGF